VAGGPVYAGALTGSIKDALNNLETSNECKVGVFGSGQGSTTPDDIAQIKNIASTLQNGNLANAIVVKIGSGEDLNARTQAFVNQLIS
jgi:hypothetical protein